MSSAVLPLSVLPALSTEVCTNTACTHANTSRELCTCTACENGAGHGIAYRVEAHQGRIAVRARMARTADVFLGAALADDDEPW